MTTPLLLVPQDVLDPRRVDEHFAAEAAAARDAGLTVSLVDHDAAARPGGAAAAVRRVPAGRAVYRGWMLPADRYDDLATALADRDVRLVTGPDRFRRTHELPGWYDAFAADTPLSTWTVGDDRPGFEAAADRLGLGPAVLRDHTKSMKHHWHEAAFVPDLADREAAWRVATRLRELRDDDFTGGFVLRRFEDLAPDEVRTWWVHGRLVAAGAHPDTPEQDRSDETRSLTDRLGPTVAALGSPFATVDLVRRGDGVWRVMEVGDGQVSDRPTSMDPAAMVAIVQQLLA